MEVTQTHHSATGSLTSSFRVRRHSDKKKNVEV